MSVKLRRMRNMYLFDAAEILHRRGIVLMLALKGLRSRGSQIRR